MKLHPLTVGPIVGETTPTRVRIWGRGKAHIIEDKPRRCFGALRFRKQGSDPWNKNITFKMNPNFDLTGIAILEKLKPEQRYEYQIGYFFSDAELIDEKFQDSDWDGVSAGQFLTASANKKKARTLVIGSCRYLLKTFLGNFFDDRGDKIFKTILKKLIQKNGIEVHQIIMMGDQIYADDLNALNPDKSVSQFYQRYRDAFSQEHIRRLMSQIPTYMTLDDHEIEDNWPAKSSDKDWKTLFPNAIHAYQTYQLSHSPLIPIKQGRLDGTPNKLWYQYSDGCCDIFVTDSRTERLLVPKGKSEMLSFDQMRALKGWLNDDSGQVKIIVTSVPFAPDLGVEESKDKWAGFQSQREEILTHIEKNQIRKVAFFSGDVHASLSIELISQTNLKIISIISSAFFWPYPHPSARQFQTKGIIDGGQAGHFRLANSSKIISDDNFTKVTVRLTQIEVETFARKGKRLEKKTHKF